jgi:hypothetical protein
VILASQDIDLASMTTFLLDEGICSMAANVQKSLELLVSVSNNKELISCDLKVDKVSNLLESELVGYAKPSLGEDGALLEFIEVVLTVP